MRRLLVLLLLIAGIGAVAPCAPAVAARPHHAGMAMPGGCHDDGQATAHACVGCAVAPEPAAPVGAAPVRAVTRYAAMVATAMPAHRAGFDPPPPRTAA